MDIPLVRSRRVETYSVVIVVAGAVAIALSAADLARHPPALAWFGLALIPFTIVGSLVSAESPVGKDRPRVLRLSADSTFVFAGALVLGPSAGSLLELSGALATLFVRLHTGWRPKRLQSLRDLAIPTMAIWLSASLADAIASGIPTTRPGLVLFVARLLIVPALYSLLVSYLLASMDALEDGADARATWRASVRRLAPQVLLAAEFAATIAVVGREPVRFSIFAPTILVAWLLFASLPFRRVLARQRDLRNDLEKTEVLVLVDAARGFRNPKLPDGPSPQNLEDGRRAVELGRALGIQDGRELVALQAAAMLRNVGYIVVPDQLLSRATLPSDDEAGRVKLHAAVGADLVKSLNLTIPVEAAVRHHHEHWDGSGYPAGLRETAIPLAARIVAVIDGWANLTSDRSDGVALTKAQAAEALRERRGTFYDPAVVDAFLPLVE